MKDIARDLGITQAAVCKALKGDTDISDATRERVRRRAEELGYKPNLLARSLITRKTQTIGLVIPELLHSFFAEICSSIGSTLRTQGYTLLLSNSENDDEIERQEVETLLARGIDGLILAPVAKTSEALLFHRLHETRIPYVLIDRVFHRARSNAVAADNREIGRMATAHLIEEGCRHIACISCLTIPTGPGRLEGYRRALAQKGRIVSDASIIDARNSDQAGYHAMRALLERKRRPDGVVCFSDPVAAGAMKAIQDTGLMVPRDIAVVGAGNVQFSGLLSIPLTTIDLQTEQFGRSAANLLLELIASPQPPKPRTILVPLDLVVRQSSRRLVVAGGKNARN